ncbi:hypothetical protein LTR99_006751 [Exophiala xenobiotica]|uniref:Uncharacterized protein n=1 Tax=Vermiconidia calcicola TaxID=1690605 RepID=A0AAV9PXR9_9PEZI|nr:hypothetical protein H2202_001541 [Exophiala xenobiotica]KAK5531747.1 hypothetical protein LTR25_008077 [Vermiconidia calcicola]KAK5542784.1 hypothetical protein LTR23_005394 [Chaetothyriales sp. CCFEE 6169]KAK5193201.1 hypothetical protein LTR92_006570 [Exophiala xenobiotica]KAK5204767.1 hypothetical protein LTR41_009623 [Exophiala xenobiotica]
MTKASGGWLTLVAYVGTIPLASLVYTTAHLAALQFNGLPIPLYPGTRGLDPSYDADYTVTSTFFILTVSVFHFLAWLAQASLCTGCELAPILSGTQGLVPRWCPQSRFKDSGKPGLADMLGTLATVKDFMQWVMVVLTILLIECARREYRRAEHVRRDMFQRAGLGVDLGGPRGDAKAPAQVPLSNISGPRILTPEEIAARQKAQQEEEERKKKAAEQRRMAAQLPSGPGVPVNKPDNYYGNGMAPGLKRTKTLNYMYDTRV